MAGPNDHLTLSPEGERFIKAAEEEGGKPKLQAYNDGTGTWTIGWGCTRGVTKGMTVTVEQAQAMFDAEMAIHIAEVHRLIKVPVSQGLFNALVSFFFNNGAGNCPTLVAAVNSGNEDKIRAAWMLYVNAYNERTKKKEPWPGLVRRRAQELAHWSAIDAKGDENADRWAPAVEVAKPVAKTAAESKSVWALLSGGVMLVVNQATDWLKDAFDFISTAIGAFPEAVSDVSETVRSSEQVSHWLGFDFKSIALGVVLVCMAVAMVRHINDKRAMP